jgi:hypothetical protein
MDSFSPPSVSRSYSGRVEIRFVREGRCWREYGRERGALKDMGLVDLEHVLAVLGRDSFACEQARRLDPERAESLDARNASVAC